MKIKKGLEISTSDFWYDLTVGGYLNPEEILENQSEILVVKGAIEALKNFQSSCEEQIEGFLQ